MQKIIGRLLLIIIIGLIVLVCYKTFKPVTNMTISATTTTTPSSNLPTGINEIEKIHSVVKEYLMSNPEVIIDAIEVLQKRKKQEMDDKVYSYIKENKQEIENSITSPYMGNENGDIIIAFFYDYNCSYCKKASHYLNQLIESDSGVKVILKPLPILGESSNYASRIILAINKIASDKLKPIHENFMALKTITKESIESLVTENDLSFAKIEEEADKTEIKDIVNKNFEVAGNLKIHGAPAYIINGRLIPGLIDSNQLKHVISEIRANAKK